MKPPLKIITLLLLALFVATASLHAEPEQGVQTLFTNLITALAKNDYDGFVAQCTPERKSVTTKTAFADMSRKIAAHGSNDTQYFGDYNQKGHHGFVWRLRFKDGSDDILVTLIPSNGKCSLLFLH